MEIEKELTMALCNDFGDIKDVEVIYKNGEQVNGFVHKLNMNNPISVILCKHEVPRGENSDHFLDFNKANAIKLTYHSGEIKEFS
jgi:hypothetical protein